MIGFTSDAKMDYGMEQLAAGKDRAETGHRLGRYKSKKRQGIQNQDRYRTDIRQVRDRAHKTRQKQGTYMTSKIQFTYMSRQRLI